MAHRFLSSLLEAIFPDPAKRTSYVSLLFSTRFLPLVDEIGPRSVESQRVPEALDACRAQPDVDKKVFDEIHVAVVAIAKELASMPRDVRLITLGNYMGAWERKGDW